MNKQDIITFFDRCAPTWDAEQIDRHAAIEAILTNAHIRAGERILDVACGTGVLFPFYLQRDVAHITGIDISPQMARLAAEKYAACDKVDVICDDVEVHHFATPFDSIMVYNAFPHFPAPQRLIRALYDCLPKGGRLTIAHGMSRQAINAHHHAAAQHVSLGLLPATELAASLAPCFDVDVVIDSEAYYQVSGIRK